MKGCLVFLLGAVFATAQVLHVEDLNTRQIRELDRTHTAIILPGGILEEHGPYLPAFTDGYLSQRLAADVARAVAARPGWKALVFPQISLGAEPYNHLGGKASFPGSYPVRAATLRAIFMDLAGELGEQGFRWILVAHVHGAGLHNRALDQASDYFHDTYGGRMAHLWGMVPVIGAWGKPCNRCPMRSRRRTGSRSTAEWTRPA
jgi:creatinine amidohydrolase/Fe(II)-dependent formamide hydrolase-like protein